MSTWDIFCTHQAWIQMCCPLSYSKMSKLWHNPGYHSTTDTKANMGSHILILFMLPLLECSIICSERHESHPQSPALRRIAVRYEILAYILVVSVCPWSRWYTVLPYDPWHWGRPWGYMDAAKWHSKSFTNYILKGPSVRNALSSGDSARFKEGMAPVGLSAPDHPFT